jgi:hypothetical protein
MRLLLRLTAPAGFILVLALDDLDRITRTVPNPDAGNTFPLETQ